MHKNQLGISLAGLMVGAAVLIVCAMLAMKMGPSYLEFASVKKAVVAIAHDKPGATVAEVRKVFDARATIDAITTITGADLEVTKEGGQLVIAANYRKEIPLAGNIGVYIDFRAHSKE